MGGGVREGEGAAEAEATRLCAGPRPFPAVSGPHAPPTPLDVCRASRWCCCGRLGKLKCSDGEYPTGVIRSAQCVLPFHALSFKSTHDCASFGQFLLSCLVFFFSFLFCTPLYYCLYLCLLFYLLSVFFGATSQSPLVFRYFRFAVGSFFL